MFRITLMLAALGLCTAHGAMSATESPRPQFHSFAPLTEGTAKSTPRINAKPTPVHTQMQATLRSDGSIELHCTERHQHTDQQRPRVEKVQ